MKKIIMILGILLLSVVLVSANRDHQSEIEEGKKLVESSIGCDKLNDEQLEAIGDYYMEQMHPGEAHELMHEMMGGHDSELTKNMHVNMAKSIYCGEIDQDMMGMMGSGGMMNNMMGGGNMMGSGMMGNNPMSYNYNPVGFGYSYGGFWYILWFLFWIGIIVLIVWLIYKFIIKKETVFETPINILKERYAKGEITKKEFDTMKKDIGGR